MNSDAIIDIPTPAILTGEDLYERTAEPIRTLIPGLLCDGLNALVGQPKSGKSWLALQIAIAVAGGPSIEGLKIADQGPVLYAALEESPARTSARIRAMAPNGGPWLKRLSVVYDILPLHTGGSDQLRRLLRSIDPRLSVIDSLTALIRSSGARSMDIFRAQYAEADIIRKLILEIKSCGILIHHARKAPASNPIEAAASSNGFAAAVDAQILLRRKPEGHSVLEVSGRELGENSIPLQFIKDPPHWIALTSSIHNPNHSTQRKNVISILSKSQPLSPAQISQALQQTPTNTRKLLNRMAQDGLITKDEGRYFVQNSLNGVT